MINRIRRAFFPHYEGEERDLHFRMIQLVLRVWTVALAAWYLGRVVLYLMIGFNRGPSPGYEIFGLLFSALTLGAGLLLVRRQHLLASGYLLATAGWIYPTLNGVLNPSELLLISPVSIVAVFIAGAIISPAAGYLYALASVASMAAAFRRAGPTPDIAGLATTGTSAVVFLVVQAAILFFAAVLMHAYTVNARRSIRRLNDQKEQLTELAHTDSLTGLANRRWLLELLEREFLRARRYHRPLSLIYLDLDGFKLVNDRFGHLFGDGILRSAARSMQAVLRGSDLLARIGGDEFAVLLPETDLAGAEKVAAKIHRALAASTRPYGAELPPLSFSAGICQLRDDDRSIDDVLVRADDAQYLAKGVGPGTVRTQHQLETGPPVAASEAAGDAHDGRDAGA